MCGITGIAYNYNRDGLHFIETMTPTLRSRGPDDCGIWVNSDDGVGFGHCRLSILDLSIAGHQPMISCSGRFVITYNGEIYNYLEIRDELIKRGAHFSGHSDTEVILGAFEQWGIVESVKRFNGMFAFGVWDRRDKTLYLARDRFGEKPLYYGWVNGSFVFASELKALKEYKPWMPVINKEVIGLFLRYSYIPDPYSIYTNIFKLNPGTILEVFHDQREKKHIYWSAESAAFAASSRGCHLSEEEAIDELHKHLSRSVEQKCISDVPLGVFLSGGIDSSLITSLTQEISSKPVKTFTIGFNEKHFNNEAPYAKKIAQHLGTEHTELYVAEKQALDVVPRLPSLYDEPFADSSQIPTYVVSTLAQQHVKVCLSGDAGDELFGGYNRYVWTNKVHSLLSKHPRLLRTTTLLSENSWDFLNRTTSWLFPAKANIAGLGHKIHKVSTAFYSARTITEFYQNIASIITNPSEFLLSSASLTINNPDSNEHWAYNNDFIHWMMLADTMNYLRGDILVKVDRAAMGTSLETRVPFLDRNVFDFAWSLPLSYKIRNGQNKYILRQLLHRYVPRELIERPKVGFGVPIGSWIRGELRPWAEELLNTRKMREQGFFCTDLISKHWKEHLSGARDRTHLLWNFLMFQAWLQSNE